MTIKKISSCKYIYHYQLRNVFKRNKNHLLRKRRTEEGENVGDKPTLNKSLERVGHINSYSQGFRMKTRQLRRRNELSIKFLVHSIHTCSEGFVHFIISIYTMLFRISIYYVQYIKFEWSNVM